MSNRNIILVLIRLYQVLPQINIFKNKKTKCTPLLIASANGHEKVVESLLKHGADVNARDERAATALHHAGMFI
jgi:ankyrin repeat protein